MKKRKITAVFIPKTEQKISRVTSALEEQITNLKIENEKLRKDFESLIEICDLYHSIAIRPLRSVPQSTSTGIKINWMADSEL